MGFATLSVPPPLWSASSSLQYGGVNQLSESGIVAQRVKARVHQSTWTNPAVFKTLLQRREGFIFFTPRGVISRQIIPRQINVIVFVGYSSQKLLPTAFGKALT